MPTIRSRLLYCIFKGLFKPAVSAAQIYYAPHVLPFNHSLRDIAYVCFVFRVGPDNAANFCVQGVIRITFCNVYHDAVIYQRFLFVNQKQGLRGLESPGEPGG